MENTKTFIKGGWAGLAIWCIITLFDAIDEYLIDTESLLGLIMCIVTPIGMALLYIVYYLKKKPLRLEILMWFSGFLLIGIVLGFIICNSVNYHKYIIDTSCHTCTLLCLNGIEYYIYAFSTIGGFTLISIIFHVIYAIVKHFRQTLKPEKN